MSFPTVFIPPSKVGGADHTTMIRQGQLRDSVISPVAPVHNSVTPNPESKDGALPQTNPECFCGTRTIRVIQPLIDSLLIIRILNPKQACVVGLAVVKSLFPSIISTDGYDPYTA